MKKLIAVSIALLPFFVQAQEKTKGFEEFTLGSLVTASAAHTFNDTTKGVSPFATDFTIAISLNTNTKHTHHHVWYNFNHNCIETLNGVFLSKDRRLDTYVFYSQPLGKESEKYLSAGIEKFLDLGFPEAKDEMEFILFAELGTNLESKTSFTCGVVFHPQLKLWNKEARKRRHVEENAKG